MHSLAQYTGSTHECFIMKEITHEWAESWYTSAFRSKYRDGSFQETKFFDVSGAWGEERLEGE